MTYTADSVLLEAVAPAPGDCNADGDIDEFDFQCFAGCTTEPGEELLPGCEGADLDGDGDVDLVDFGIFQILYGS